MPPNNLEPISVNPKKCDDDSSDGSGGNGTVLLDPIQFGLLKMCLDAIVEAMGEVAVSLDAESLADLIAALEDANLNVTVEGGTITANIGNLDELSAIIKAAVQMAIEMADFPPLEVEIIGGELVVSLDADTLAAIEAAVTAGIENATFPELDVNVTGGELVISGTVGLDADTLAALEDITVSGEVSLSADTIANIQGALEAALGNVEVEVTLNGEEVTVNGTVALDADTLAALEDITVNGIVALDADTIAAIADALAGLEVEISQASIDALIDALENASLTVTVDGGTLTVDGTVDIGNLDDLADALSGLDVVVSGTVGIDQASIDALVAALEAATLTVTVDGGTITVDGTVSIDNLGDLADILDGLNVVVSGTVSIDSLPDVVLSADTIADLAAAIAAALDGLTVTIDGQPIEITGTVSVDNFSDLVDALEGLAVTATIKNLADLEAAFENALNNADDIDVILDAGQLADLIAAIAASDVDDTDDDIRPQVTESKRCLFDAEGKKIPNTCVYDVIKFSENGTPSAFDTVYLVDGSFSTEPPEGATVGFCPTKCTTCEVVTGCEIVSSLPTQLTSGSIGGSSTSGFNGTNHWIEFRDIIGFSKGGILENLIDECVKNKGFIYGEHRNAGEGNSIQVGLSMENVVSLIKIDNPVDPELYSSIRIETGPPLRDCGGELQSYWDAHQAGEAPQKPPPNINQLELYCVKYQDITEELPADRVKVCGPVTIAGPVEVTGQVDTSGSQVVSGFICDTDDSRYGDPVWWCQGKDINGNPLYPGGEKCPTVYSGKYTIVTSPDGECRQVSVSKAINGLAEFGYGSGGAGTNTHTLKLAQTALGANLANEIMNGGAGQICTVSLGGGKTFTYDRRNVQVTAGVLGDGNSISFSSTLQNDVAGCEAEYLAKWDEQVDLAGETTGYGTSCTTFRFVATGEPEEGDCTLPLDPQPNAIAIGSPPALDDGSSGCSRWSDVFCEVGTGREYRHLYDCDGNVIRREFLPEGEEACFNRQVVRGYVDVCIKKADGTFANMSAMYSGGGTFTKFVDPATQEDYQIAEGDTVHAGHCEEICCGEFCILDAPNGSKTGQIADKIRTRCGGKFIGPVRYIGPDGAEVAANLIDRSCCS